MTASVRVGAFVVTSRLMVPSGGEAALEVAFKNRLRAVDGWPGFLGLEVWQDGLADSEYLLVTWWNTPADYRSYMRSTDHRASHARIPTGDLAPRAVAVRRYRVVAR